MTIAFDHLIILVRDLDAAVRDYEQLGFTVDERSDAVEGAMANRFICFADGSYLLLSAFHDLETAGSHRLAPLLAEREGWADYSYVVDNVGAAAERLRDAGLPARGPIRVANALTSGETWALDLLMAGIGAGGEEALPFLVQDVEGRNHRIPQATRHRNGATGVAGVRLRASSIASVLGALTILLGEKPVPAAEPEAGRVATRYHWGSTWLEIVEDGKIPVGRGRLEGAVLTCDGTGMLPEVAISTRAAIDFV